jgi:hypothetical protein
MGRYPVNLQALLRIRYEKLAALQGYPPLAQRLEEHFVPKALKARPYE